MESVAQNNHRCAECGRDTTETRFRLNGSGTLRKYCEECGKARVKRLRETPSTALVPQPVDDTPRPIGYAVLRHGDAVISFEPDRSAACLTDIWRAAGSPENKDPRYWLRQAQTLELLAQYADENNVIGDHVTTTRRGNSTGAGTWAPKEIALAYAQYLSPALYLACNRFVLDRMGAAAALPAQANEILLRLLDQNNAVMQALGLLPGIDQTTRATAAALAGVERVHTRQVIRGQVYIIRLTDAHYIELAKRLLRDTIRPDQHLIAIGRTGADGNIQELRLEDYGGKFPFRPEDYELLGALSTDEPKAVEALLLEYPLTGAVRGTLAKGAKSRTFLLASASGVQEYRSFGSGYHALATLRMAFGGAQLDLFGGVQ